MIDLHCHLLPGIDDGAPDLATSIKMARQYVADGITHVACTPHIMPGVWANEGPDIRQRVDQLQAALREEDIDLQLFPGADNHIVADFVAALQEGRLLTLADSRYVLVEPPHHVAPPRLEEFFFGILVAGYVPILTHPERLTWLSAHYETISRLVAGGVWMQVTAGSLTGQFGKRAKTWAEKMLDDGNVHILATDAHDPEKRRPELSQGWALARARVGEEEAERLVLHRPFAILIDAAPSTVPMPTALGDNGREEYPDAYSGSAGPDEGRSQDIVSPDNSDRGWMPRGLRGLFK